MMAGFRTRKPAVNEPNNLALLFRYPLKNLQKLAKRQVIDFAASKPLHPLEV